MKNIPLADLTKKRRAHVNSCRENRDTAHKIVADMYSSKTHFIYELIHNADDAGANNIFKGLGWNWLLFPATIFLFKGDMKRFVFFAENGIRLG